MTLTYMTIGGPTMPACERCWSVYTSRQLGGYTGSYQDVVREEERYNGGPCSMEDQCGEMHLVLDWKDGSKRCRCGKVVEKEADDAK